MTGDRFMGKKLGPRTLRLESVRDALLTSTTPNPNPATTQGDGENRMKNLSATDGHYLTWSQALTHVNCGVSESAGLHGNICN
jgi:hypothetical protein